MKIIGTVIIIASVICAAYVGGWLMFIQPVLDACNHFDNGTLTGTIVGTTVIKCVFASFVGSVISLIGVSIGSLVREF